MYRIGVDIGGTKIAVGVFDAEKQLIASEKYYIAEAGDLPSFIKNSVERLCGGRGISLKELAACGAAVPGTVDGFRATPARQPCSRIAASARCRCVSASAWITMRSAPAFAKEAI